MVRRFVKKDKSFDEIFAEKEKDYKAVVALRKDLKKKQDEVNKLRDNADTKEVQYKADMYDLLLNQLDLKGVHYSLKDIVKACVYVNNHFAEEVPDEAFIGSVNVISSEASLDSVMGDEGND